MATEYNFHTPPQEAARDAFGEIFDFTNFQVKGQENLEFLKKAGSVAIFAFFPHAGHLDSPAVRKAVPLEFREKLLYPAAADYWYKNGVRGKIKAGLSSMIVPNFPMYRNESGLRGVEDSLNLAAEFLRLGYILVMSPEGSRSNLSLDKRKLHTGVAELSLVTGKPIVPVGIRGMENVLPRGKIIPRFRENGYKRIVKVIFGKPIDPNSYDLTAGQRKLRREITSKLESDLIKLCTVN